MQHAATGSLRMLTPRASKPSSPSLLDAHRASPVHIAAALKQRFDRDERCDWKFEYHRRQTALQQVQAQAGLAETAHSNAVVAMDKAQAALDAWKEAQAKAKAKAEEEEDEEPEPEEGEERELSREEEGFQAAEKKLRDTEQRASEAAEKLAASQAAMVQPFVRYQAYWVEGLGSTLPAVQAVTASGSVPLRAAVYARAPPPRARYGEPPPEEHPAPELFSALKAASQQAEWDSPLCLMVALEVELPPTPAGERDREKGERER
jgi:hypothetical protein